MGDLLIIAASAYLNRFAGGGWPGHLFDEHRSPRLPGRALYPAALLMVPVAMLAGVPVYAALAFGLLWALWRSPAWGYLISLGHETPGKLRGPSDFEAFCLGLSGGNVLVALMLRHAIPAVPAFVLLSFTTTPFAIWAWGPWAILSGLAYALAWKMTPRAPLLTAEILVGALWGAVLVLSAW